jgi:putative phage-type endonuclease
MKIVNFPNDDSGSPNTVEWHKWRLGGIGSSESVIVAVDAGFVKPASWVKSLNHLFKVKTGLKNGDIPVNIAMQRGIIGEKYAREAYQIATGNIVMPLFGEMDGYPFIRASFDGVTFSGKILAEMKCPSEEVHRMALAGEVVSYYQPQLLHQALVLWGHPSNWNEEMEMHFVSYVPEIDSVAIVKTRAVDVRIQAESLFESLIIFWRMVESKQAPCGDEWLIYAKRYLMAKAEADLAASTLDAIKQDFESLMDGKKRKEGGGVVAYSSERKGKADNKAIIQDLSKRAGITEVELLGIIKTHTGAGSTSFTVKSIKDDEYECERV